MPDTYFEVDLISLINLNDFDDSTTDSTLQLIPVANLQLRYRFHLIPVRDTHIFYSFKYLPISEHLQKVWIFYANTRQYNPVAP